MRSESREHFRNARLTAGDPPDFVYILMEGPANIMVGGRYVMNTMAEDVTLPPMRSR
jgi:hypothetical protein